VISPTADQLRSCLAVERWIADVIAGGPYESREQLLSFARASATPLARDEIDEAIAHHPRIGDKAAAGSFSAAEQASAPDADDAATNAAIAAGNTAYESRFGRVFIVRAAGRSRAEILAEQQRRLALPPEDELAIVGEQLVEIALLRMETVFA
jgi:2-oxo-4-hydroxy-4-carboxy-5-ureidoimidazoline decarboxylase